MPGQAEYATCAPLRGYNSSSPCDVGYILLAGYTSRSGNPRDSRGLPELELCLQKAIETVGICACGV